MENDKITKTINKWFEETDAQMHQKIKDFTSIDGLCACVLRAAMDYCNAIFLLLRKERELPAKALLRVLCELMVKLSWCLTVPDKQNENEQETVKEKIRRWEKYTLCNNIRILEKFKEVTSGDDKKKIQDSIDNLKIEQLFSDKRIKEMLKFLDLVKQLPDLFKNEVYPLLYLQFNNAVHLDVTSLVDSVLKQGKNGMQYDSDVKDLAKYNVAHAFHITCLIRKNYGWRTDEIEKEYREIMRS